MLEVYMSDIEDKEEYNWPKVAIRCVDMIGTVLVLLIIAKCSIEM